MEHTTGRKHIEPPQKVIIGIDECISRFIGVLSRKLVSIYCILTISFRTPKIHPQYLMIRNRRCLGPARGQGKSWLVGNKDNRVWGKSIKLLIVHNSHFQNSLYWVLGGYILLLNPPTLKHRIHNAHISRLIFDIIFFVLFLSTIVCFVNILPTELILDFLLLLFCQKFHSLPKAPSPDELKTWQNSQKMDTFLNLPGPPAGTPSIVGRGGGVKDIVAMRNKNKVVSGRSHPHHHAYKRYWIIV